MAAGALRAAWPQRPDCCLAARAERTVAGEVAAVESYVGSTREYEPFSTIDFRWSEATGTEFPRLSVKVRSELVTYCTGGICCEVLSSMMPQRGTGTSLNRDWWLSIVKGESCSARTAHHDRSAINIVDYATQPQPPPRHWPDGLPGTSRGPHSLRTECRRSLAP